MASMRTYLAPEFTAMAHRGGALLPANHGIENTLVAFRNAVDLGFDYLETDVHTTRDGVLVAFHDTSLERVADTSAQISEVSAAQLRDVRVGGREPIPTVDELFETFPRTRFNLDIKAPGAVRPLAEAIRRHGAEQRVCVGSFSELRIRKFRRLMPGVPTSAARVEVMAMAAGFVQPARPGGSPPRVFQVPVSHTVGPLTVQLVTPRTIRAIHAAGRRLHVWTIDDAVAMHQLIDWGVDGLITDRPDVLKGVLRDRGMWSTQSGN